MPHTRSLESDDAIEEERRLVYVGMTRARERLHLTWAQSRQVFGQRRTSQPSRFLDEIPRDRLEVSGEAARAPQSWGRGGTGAPAPPGRGAAAALRGRGAPARAGPPARCHRTCRGCARGPRCATPCSGWARWCAARERATT